MNRAVILSVCAHETDTVECFIRHHCSVASRVILLVTHPDALLSNILNGLKAEGLPVTWISGQGKGKRTEQMQDIARGAFAEWICILDPDEFLVLPPERTFEDILRQLPKDRVTLLPQHTYVPTPEDNMYAPSILRQITHRKSFESAQGYAPLVPVSSVHEKCVLTEDRVLLKATDGPPLETVRSAVLAVADFPVRSSDQFTTQIISDAIAIASRGNTLPHTLRHLFERTTKGQSFSATELRNVALRFGAHEGGVELPSLLRDPVPTTVHALRYSQAHRHPLEIVAGDAIDLATELSTYRGGHHREEPQGIEALAAQLGSSIDVIARELAPLMQEAEDVGPLQEGAMVLALSLLAACLRHPQENGASPLRTRLALAESLPALPPRWSMLRDILQQPKLPSTLEVALRQCTDVCCAIGNPTLAHACRIDRGNDDRLSALLCTLVEGPQAAHVTPAVAVFTANATHTLLQKEWGIVRGLADQSVCIADPLAGTGDMLREVLRRMIIGAIDRGTNPLALQEDLRMRLSAHTASSTLSAALHLHCATILEQYGMPFAQGQTVDVCFGDLPRTRIERPIGYDPQTIAAVVTKLPFIGASSKYRTVSPLQSDVLHAYTVQQRKYGTDLDLERDDGMHALAAIQVLLERSDRSLGVIVAPRKILHGAAYRDVRRHLTESFEQIWVMDLHGEGGLPDDEPLPESDASGLCILMLLRGGKLTQHVRYCELQGLKLQKMHALFFKSLADFPWKRIGSEYPMYVLLP